MRWRRPAISSRARSMASRRSTAIARSYWEHRRPPLVNGRRCGPLGPVVAVAPRPRRPRAVLAGRPRVSGRDRDRRRRAASPHAAGAVGRRLRGRHGAPAPIGRLACTRHRVGRSACQVAVGPSGGLGHAGPGDRACSGSDSVPGECGAARRASPFDVAPRRPVRLGDELRGRHGHEDRRGTGHVSAPSMSATNPTGLDRAAGRYGSVTAVAHVAHPLDPRTLRYARSNRRGVPHEWPRCIRGVLWVTTEDSVIQSRCADGRGSRRGFGSTRRSPTPRSRRRARLGDRQGALTSSVASPVLRHRRRLRSQPDRVRSRSPGSGIGVGVELRRLGHQPLRPLTSPPTDRMRSWPSAERRPIRLVVRDDLAAEPPHGPLPPLPRDPALRLAGAPRDRGVRRRLRQLARCAHPGRGSREPARLRRVRTSATRHRSAPTSFSRRTRIRGSAASPSTRSTSRSTRRFARAAGAVSSASCSRCRRSPRVRARLAA